MPRKTSFTNRVQKRVLFNLDAANGLTLLGAYKVGINLGRCHVFVGKHLRHRIDVGSSGNLKSRVSVSEAVEGDMLLDTGFLNPILQRNIYH